MSYSTPVPIITCCLTRSFRFAGNEIVFAFETFRCRMGESVFARDERSDRPSERSELVRLCKSADLKLRGQRPANCPQRLRHFRLENIVASWRAHLHRHRSRPTPGHLVRPRRRIGCPALTRRRSHPTGSSAAATIIRGCRIALGGRPGESSQSESALYPTAASSRPGSARSAASALST